jgi:hypothetical protein
MKRKKAILFSFLIFPLLLSAGIYAEKIKEKTVISIGFFQEAIGMLREMNPQKYWMTQ